MKPSFVRILGLLLLVGAVVSLTFASREAYHNYLYQRYGAQDVLDTGRFTPDFTADDEVHRILVLPNLRFSQEDTRNAYTQRSYSNASFPRRTYTIRTEPWKKPLKRQEIAFPEDIEAYRPQYIRFVNDAFSIDVPWTMIPNLHNDVYVFSSPREDYSIRIKKLPECNQVSFSTCAIAFSKNENYETARQKVLTTSRIVRRSYAKDTVFSVPSLQTEVFNESFSAEFGGSKGEYYVARSFVRDLDGRPYLIETRSDIHEAPDYLGVTKDVFDSFRIIVHE